MKELIRILNLKGAKKSTIIILIFTVFMTIVETVGISLMMPFVQVATDFSVIQTNEYYKKIYEFLNFDSKQAFVLSFGTFLLLFFLTSGLLTVFYQYKVSRYAKQWYKQVVEKLFRGFIGLSYREFIERNSGRMVQIIAQEAHSSESLIRTMIASIGNLLTIIVVYGLLIVLDWKITLVFTLILGVNILLLSYTVTPVVKRKGHERTELYQYVYRSLFDTFGNFKMIKLRTSEEKITTSFSDLIKRLTNLMVESETLQQIPKLFLELIGFSLIISIIMYWIIDGGSDITEHMGMLTVFFFAMYRLMPATNQVISSVNSMIALKKSLDLIKENLLYETENLGEKECSFKNEIKLDMLSFEYLKNKPVLKDINLSIKKGENIAFIGSSGSGKSTIVDLIIGLYQPASGKIYLDGTELNSENIRSWRRNIGYIPQDIYLFDASVAENIALESFDNIDENRVVEVLKQAHIYDFLKDNLEGVNTIVGDKGVKLSGGQKQRIAIARALYHDPDVLVLDEATSALDTTTEKEIMKNIYEAGEGKTLIIIAHRLSTITQCDVIYTLENGTIVDVKDNTIGEES